MRYPPNVCSDFKWFSLRGVVSVGAAASTVFFWKNSILCPISSQSNPNKHHFTQTSEICTHSFGILTVPLKSHSKLFSLIARGLKNDLQAEKSSLNDFWKQKQKKLSKIWEDLDFSSFKIKIGCLYLHIYDIISTSTSVRPYPVVSDCVFLWFVSPKYFDVICLIGKALLQVFSVYKFILFGCPRGPWQNPHAVGSF